MSNVLYCGDNREVLEEYIPSESVDLVYLDPPFNSQRVYNVVYKNSRAQEEAFKDYWSWQEAAVTYNELLTSHEVPIKVRNILKALHEQLIDDDSDLLAYLTMMAPRLVGLHRVLKQTGSLYLHCDPTASHYLKVLLDAIFGADNFLAEIAWKRYGAHGNSTRYGAVHDVLLFYGKTRSVTFNKQFIPYSDDYAESRFRHVDKNGRRYQEQNLQNPSYRPNLIYPYKASNGITYEAPKNGWKCEPDRMRQLDTEGRLHFPRNPKGRLRMKMFLDECEGVPVQDVWTDIVLGSTTKERVEWPTQKPVALLARVLGASSNPGDLVLDPFCGCGSTIIAAERLGRRWIGIDIARKAVEVLEKRFAEQDPPLPAPSIVWHPVDEEAAIALAERDKDQFETWVRRKLRAEKRRHDRGIDGESFYKDNTRSWHVIISVKGGKTLNPAMVRELRGTIERERADVGVLVCTHESSREMRLEATRANFLPVKDVAGPIPRLQIVTVEQLFKERRPIRVPGENNYRPTPTIPQMGQTGFLFTVPVKKVGGARDAQARAKAEAGKLVVRLSPKDQPTTKAASLDVTPEPPPSKPGKRQSSRPPPPSSKK